MRKSTLNKLKQALTISKRVSTTKTWYYTDYSNHKKGKPCAVSTGKSIKI